jgi:hypothetical protein
LDKTDTLTHVVASATPCQCAENGAAAAQEYNEANVEPYEMYPMEEYEEEEEDELAFAGEFSFQVNCNQAPMTP